MGLVVKIIEQNINQNKCITLEEIRTLVDSYPYANFWRINWLLMATTGMRSCEVVSLKKQNP